MVACSEFLPRASGLGRHCLHESSWVKEDEPADVLELAVDVSAEKVCRDEDGDEPSALSSPCPTPPSLS